MSYFGNKRFYNIFLSVGYNITVTYPISEEEDKIFLEKVERLKEIIDSILEIKEGKWYE